MTEQQRLRARIEEMLSEIHADRRKFYSNDELRDVLGSDGMVRCVQEMRKCQREDQAQLKADNYDYWAKDEPRLWSYREYRETAIRECQAIESHMATALRDKQADPSCWNKKNAGGHSYESRWRSWVQQLPEYMASLRKSYEGLTEREKLFLTSPVPNPVTPDQFPAPSVATAGYFYPKRSAAQRAQIAALTTQLIKLDDRTMTFNHYTRIHDGNIIHTFSGVVEHHSQILRDFDAFVARHDMEHESYWSMEGMCLSAYTDDPALAALFKLTF